MKIKNADVKPAAKSSTAQVPQQTRSTATKPAVAQRFKKDELSAGMGRALRERATRALGSTGLRAPPATSLLTENPKDAQQNCLDRAYDRLAAMTPQQRAQTDLVFLRDTRPGAEGASGHVLLRENGRFVDPLTGNSYASLAQFDPERVYSPAGTLAGTVAHAVLSAPPGSAARSAALEQVPAVLRTMMVADTTLSPMQRVGEIREAQGAYDAAKADRAALDQQLAKELAALGPTLTETQRRAYTESFRASADYQAKLDAERAAADELAATLAEHEPALREFMSSPAVAGPTYSRPETEWAREAVTAVLSGYEALATSPAADAALQFANSALQGNTPYKFVREIYAQTGYPAEPFDLQSRILAPAMQASMTTYLADHPEATGDAAVDHIRALIPELSNLQVDATNGLTVGEALNTLRRFATGDVTAAEALKKIGSTSRLGAAFAAMGVVTGVLSGIDALANGDVLGALSSSLAATNSGATALAFALDHMGSAAARSATFATRLAAGAGALASVVDIIRTLGKDHLNTADYVAMGANVVVIGATLASLAFPPAGAVAAIATLVALGASIISGNEDERRAQDEFWAGVQQHLEAAGIPDASTRAAMARRYGSSLDVFTLPPPQGPGLTGDQLVGIYSASPDLLVGTNAPVFAALLPADPVALARGLMSVQGMSGGMVNSLFADVVSYAAERGIDLKTALRDRIDAFRVSAMQVHGPQSPEARTWNDAWAYVMQVLTPR